MSRTSKKFPVEVGKKYKIYHGKGNPSNRTYHIRGIIDGNQVVARFWSTHKRRWEYNVNDISFYEIRRNAGVLTPAR
jgi:hypothetical protein